MPDASSPATAPARAAAPPLHWPRLRLRPALGFFVLFAALGLWQGITVLLDARSGGSRWPWTRPIALELTGYLSAWATLYILYAAASNAPTPAVGWRRFLAVHLIAFVLFNTLKNTIMFGSRYILFPLFGWEHYSWPRPSLQLAMETMKDLWGYVVWMTIWLLYQGQRRRQAEILRTAELASELREARLQALTNQLNPHFLFNALNTVSSVMYEDLARTDRLLSELGAILRASLDGGQATWSLGEERAHTERFLHIMAARLGERLRVRWQLAPGLEAARVPRFALQLLAENAIKHNHDRREGIELRLRGERHHGELILEVEDDGRGFDAALLRRSNREPGGLEPPARARSPFAGAGVGLASLRRAMELLHGEPDRVLLAAGPEGGARVRLRVPWTAA